jgi:hypothetical protein
MNESRQVAWAPVHRLLAPLLGAPGLAPGTPAWCDLDDTDPAKWRAVLWSAVWWSVAEDARQEALADASRAVSAAADWPGIARAAQRRRSGVYIPRAVA